MKNNQPGKPTVFFKQLTERNFGFIAKSFHEKSLSLGYSACVGNGLNIVPLAQIILCILLCQRISSDQVNKRREKVIGPPRAGFLVPQVAQRLTIKQRLPSPLPAIGRGRLVCMGLGFAVDLIFGVNALFPSLALCPFLPARARAGWRRPP